MSRIPFVASRHLTGLIAWDLLHRLTMVCPQASAMATRLLGTIVLIATLFLTLGLADRMKEHASQDHLSIGDSSASEPAAK